MARALSEPLATTMKREFQPGGSAALRPFVATWIVCRSDVRRIAGSHGVSLLNPFPSGCGASTAAAKAAQPRTGPTRALRLRRQSVRPIGSSEELQGVSVLPAHQSSAGTRRREARERFRPRTSSPATPPNSPQPRILGLDHPSVVRSVCIERVPGPHCRHRSMAPAQSQCVKMKVSTVHHPISCAS